MPRAINTAADSLDFFVQAQDSLSLVLDVAATATGTNNSADIKNTYHRGATLYVTVVSLTVNTATLAFNLMGKNAASDADDPSAYFNIARISLDGIAATGGYAAQIYPGLVASGGAGVTPGGFSQTSAVLPAVFQIQASLTAVTTASMSGTLSYEVGMSRSL